MPSRHRSRQRALQILFLWDARNEPAQKAEAYPVEKAIDAFYDTMAADESGTAAGGRERDGFANALVHGAVEHLSDLDTRIAKHAAHWRLERMPAVDRNLLRVAAYELVYEGTPAAVVIDEALELARKFSGEESVQFVNGVLDAIHREIPVRDPGARPA